MKNFRKWIALLVVFSMVSGLGLHQFGSSLRANEAAEPAASEKMAVEEAAATEPTGTKSVKTDEAIVSEMESSGEQQTQESVPVESQEAVEASAPEKAEYTISIKEPEKDGGSVFAWSDGSRKQISFSNGIYKEKVKEAVAFNLQIETKNGYQVEKVERNDGSILAPVSVDNNTYSYKLDNISSDDQLKITYKEAGEAKAEVNKEDSDKADNKDDIKAEDTEADKADKSDKPSQTLKARAGGAVITVTAPAGALPEGATVKAVKVNSLAVENSVENAVKDEGQKLADYAAYDITIYDKDGKKIQPDDSVKVAISGVDVKGEEQEVYHIDSNGVEKVESTATGKNTAFNAESFSIYAVVITAKYNGLFGSPNYTFTAGLYDVKMRFEQKNGTLIDSGLIGSKRGEINQIEMTANDSVDIREWLRKKGLETIGDYKFQNAFYYFEGHNVPNGSKVYVDSFKIGTTAPHDSYLRYYGKYYDRNGNVVMFPDGNGGKTQNSSWELQADGVLHLVYDKADTKLYKVTYHSNFANGPEDKVYNFEEGVQVIADEYKIVFHDITNEGYEFKGWSDSPKGAVVYNENQQITSQITTDYNLYAVWEKNTVTINYKAVGKGQVSTEKEELNKTAENAEGSTAIPDAGYKFAGWYGDENCTQLLSEDYNYSPKKPADGWGNEATYYAKFVPKDNLSYTVHYYWNKTSEKVADDKVVSGKSFDETVEEQPIDIKDYTPVSDAVKSISINEGNNEIVFYYYKNVNLKANSDEVIYNGNEQSVSGFTGAPKGVNFAGISVEAKGTDAGIYKAEFANGTVGKTDESEKYIVNKAENGTLKITPRPVEIKAAAASKTYGEVDPTFTDASIKNADGTELSAKLKEELKDVNLNVTRSDADSADSEKLGKHAGVLSISATKKQLDDKYTNYTFTITPADFTIIKNEKALTVSATPVEKVYDGKAQGVTATAGIAGATIKYWNEETNAYDLDESPAYTNVGEKTVKFEASLYGYKTATGETTVKITPAKITIIPDSKTKRFEEDDPAFTGNISGNIAGDDIGTITYIRTNDDEKVGTYEDVLSAEVTNPNSNYTYTVVPADFTITKAGSNIATITSAVEDLTKFYDGKRVSVNAKADKAGSTLLYSTDGEEWSQDNPGFANAGTYTVYVKAINDNFEDTPVVSATIVINPRTVVISSGNASKNFDGSALTSDRITVSEYNAETGEGFIEGEGADYNITGAQIEVGSSDNTFEYTLKEGTIADNYRIVVEPGTLTVVAVSDNPIVTPGGNDAPPVPPGTVIRVMTGAPPAVANFIGGALQNAGTRVSELVESEDDEVPLANMNGEHKCCIFHFLLMLIALILLALYTRYMKKRQEELFELKRRIDEERAAQGLPPAGEERWIRK